MHANSTIDFQDPTPVISKHSKYNSSNRIKIQVILLILQLETDYFSSLFISEKSYLKQRHSTVFQDFQKLHSTWRSPTGFFNSTHYRVPHTETNSTCKKTKSSWSTLQDLPKAFQTFQSFMTFRQLLHTEGKKTFIPEKDILHPEGKETFIFYISAGSTETPPSTSWTIQTTSITFIKEREMLRYRSNKTLFSRIELFPSIVLSPRVTNYKNDIQ